MGSGTSLSFRCSFLPFPLPERLFFRQDFVISAFLTQRREMHPPNFAPRCLFSNQFGSVGSRSLRAPTYWIPTPIRSIQPNGPRGISQMSLFLTSTSRESTAHRGGVNLYSPIIPWALITLIFPPLSVNGWFPRREERSKPTYCLQA